jgi:hypothetical protein
MCDIKGRSSGHPKMSLPLDLSQWKLVVDDGTSVVGLPWLRYSSDVV